MLKFIRKSSWEGLFSRTSVIWVVFKYSRVSNVKSVRIVIRARIERMEPLFVPSKRSTGTLRYMSRFAIPILILSYF